MLQNNIIYLCLYNPSSKIFLFFYYIGFIYNSKKFRQLNLVKFSLDN